MGTAEENRLITYMGSEVDLEERSLCFLGEWQKKDLDLVRRTVERCSQPPRGSLATIGI